jgi:hypothetical protein
MADYYPRWQNKTIETAMKERRVLLLTGPRQCGKTTTVRHLAPKGTEYRTLDDGTLKEAAEADPRGFVEHDEGMLIIDEVQRAPALLPAIKKVVDEDTRPGQFLLTGSANIQTLSNVQESLAGRVAKIRLRTLAVGEIQGAQPEFLQRAFGQNFGHGWQVHDRDDILVTAFRGGFPEAITLNGRARRRWHRDYIEALLERDLKDIARIYRHDAMVELVRILAAWSAKFMDISAIGAGLSIRRPTLETYINALEQLYLVERVHPWTKTDYGRVGKQSKLFMTDGGLMASILGWRLDQVRLDPDRAGKLVETFAFNELAALVDMSDGEYALYHYRDREQREIDFLIERDDGALLGIEIKAAASVNKGDFKHLAWFRDNLAKDRPFVGIVLYAGTFSGSFGDGLWSVPFGAMWGLSPRHKT